ncbi:MAG: Dabb family protein [Verrucomicrobiota bacterium]
MKKLLPLLLLAGLTALGTATASAQEPKKEKKAKKAVAAEAVAETMPKTVIHVVTLKWKDDATPEQIQAALDGVKALPSKFPGITRVWVRSISVQNAPGTELKRTHAFVMEFASEQALKEYKNSPAQLEWYKVYEPARHQSTTHDITN